MQVLKSLKIMMQQTGLYALSILVILNGQSNALDSPCGADWTPFREDKCFKIFDKLGLLSYADAEKACAQQDNASSSSLISIGITEEQQFVTNLFKTNKIADNAWLGVKLVDSKYKWLDNSDLIFTNWAASSPTNKADHCAQLIADENSLGKWSDVLCTKKNLVVCQKTQTWTLPHVQKLLLNAIKTIQSIQSNPFPIGFIYAQLPGENAPAEIWPTLKWEDMSVAYNGTFFRVAGGEAATFGQIQDGNSPRLTSVTQNGAFCSSSHTLSNTSTVGNWYIGDVCTGGTDSSSNKASLRFSGTDGEVRPRNMAMRIWKRTG